MKSALSLSLSANTTFAARLRRAMPRLWLLHGVLIANFFLLSSWRLAHAEGGDPPPEETWSYQSSQASLTAEIVTSGSTSGVTPGTAITISATPLLTTWDIYVSNLDCTRTRIENLNPNQIPSGSSVTVSYISGDGWLNTACSPPVFTVGSGSAIVRVTVAANGITSDHDIEFTPAAPETWTYSTTEGALGVSVACTDSTSDLAQGTNRSVTAQVVWVSWDVEVSNYGNSRTTNPSTSPASGATVYWSATGDGAVSEAQSTCVQDGTTAVNFTMGTSASTVTATAYYGDTTTAVASAGLDFSPLDLTAWRYDHTEGYISTELAEVGRPSSNAPGSLHPLAATVLYTSWQVWRRGVEPNVEYENRNETTAPAINASVAFEITGGGGSLPPEGGGSATDANGIASITYRMGGSVAEVRATASFAGATGFGTTTMTPDIDTRTWTKVADGSGLTVTASASDLSASTARVAATAIYATWEIWRCDEDTTLTEERNRISGPAINGDVSFSVSGSATVTSSDSATGASGMASAVVAKGASPSQVHVSASYAGQTASCIVGVGSVASNNAQIQAQIAALEQENAQLGQQEAAIRSEIQSLKDRLAIVELAIKGGIATLVEIGNALYNLLKVSNKTISDILAYIGRKQAELQQVLDDANSLDPSDPDFESKIAIASRRANDILDEIKIAEDEIKKEIGKQIILEDKYDERIQKNEELLEEKRLLENEIWSRENCVVEISDSMNENNEQIQQLQNQLTSL